MWIFMCFPKEMVNKTGFECAALCGAFVLPQIAQNKSRIFAKFVMFYIDETPKMSYN